jgi:acetyltransferase-like isoleucine patch superfamily enzyme
MPTISDLAVVQTNAIGRNVTIHEFCVVRDDVVIGDNVIIHPHVVIEPGARIANNVEIFPGAYIGKVPKGAGALSRPPVFEQRIEIGENCSIGPHAVIFYGVTIGPSTLIGDGASIREGSRIGSKSIIGRYVTLNYDTIVGSRVRVQDHSWLCGNMVIEDDVFISGSVGTANDNAIGRNGYDNSQVGPHIERGAAVGVGAQLLPGTRIGADAIVGAGAVVTRDVPPGTVVMGIPAQVVRQVDDGQQQLAADD